jgi:hypothetical protein
MAHKNDRLAIGEPVPSSRLYSVEKRLDARLVVSADESLNSRCMIRIHIDGHPAADIRSGEVAGFWLTFGTHTVSALPLAGCDQRDKNDVKINMKSGDLLVKRLANNGFFQAAN